MSARRFAREFIQARFSCNWKHVPFCATGHHHIKPCQRHHHAVDQARGNSLVPVAHQKLRSPDHLDRSSQRRLASAAVNSWSADAGGTAAPHEPAHGWAHPRPGPHARASRHRREAVLLSCPVSQLRLLAAATGHRIRQLPPGEWGSWEDRVRCHRRHPQREHAPAAGSEVALHSTKARCGRETIILAITAHRERGAQSPGRARLGHRGWGRATAARVARARPGGG